MIIENTGNILYLNNVRNRSLRTEVGKKFQNIVNLIGNNLSYYYKKSGFWGSVPNLILYGTKPKINERIRIQNIFNQPPYCISPLIDSHRF